MKPNKINTIRNAALKLENQDLQMAYDLMYIAHQQRPTGPFIKEKLNEYKNKLLCHKENLSLINKSVLTGDIAIIPIGFRCGTAKMIEEKLGVTQASFPFNNGFFSPDAVASVLKTPNINMSFNDKGQSHNVCILTKNVIDDTHGSGIQFQSSTYKYIDSIAVDKNVKDLYKYLDSTYAYYTHDMQHNLILAHYNWHSLSNYNHSKGITNPLENLEKINNILNKRIIRMLDVCDKAKHIFFIFGNNEDYNYLKIDTHLYHLNDFK